jgi:hypothetical protein
MVFLGCAAHPTYRMGNESEKSFQDSKASPEVWSVDYFSVRKPELIRSPNDYPFYYKHCSMNDNQTFYSKTSYWCNDP